MSIVLQSSGGGSVTLQEPSTASNVTVTIPATTGTAVLQNGSNNLLMNSGYGSDAVAYGCRAWVNFDGTGTPAIRASGNVSSITDNYTGNWNVNLINAMPDTNYSIIAFMQPTVTNNGSDTFSNMAFNTTNSVNLVHFEDGVNRDSNFISLAVFR